jgi:hypothetical protein
MDVLSKEKTKVLAEKTGWSVARAEGFVDGEAFRRRGKVPSAYARIGIDDYCLGFRAGFYDRETHTLAAEIPALNVVRRPLQKSQDSSELTDITMASAHGG